MFSIGDAKVHAVPEMTLREPLEVFPTLEPGLLERLGSDYAADGCFLSAIRSWVVHLPGLTVVIDTGAGNGRHRPASPRFGGLDTPFLDNLAAAGATPETVGLVICTHLHVDHVGWNTRWVDGAWQPTFRNARYVLPTAEVLYWRDGPGAAEPDAPRRQPFLDSVLPLLGRASTMLAEGTEPLADGLRLVRLPGHSPAMMGVALERRGQRALFIADALHNPVQIWRPECSSRYCADPAQATATRVAMLREASATGTLLLAAHVGGSGGLRIRAAGHGFDFEPEPPDT